MASLYKGDEYLKSYSPFMDKIEYSDLLDFSYKFIALYFKKEREKQDSLYVFENWNGIINKKSLLE